LEEIGFGTTAPTILRCANQSAIQIARNPIFHNRTKHFEVNWHFSRQQVKKGTISIEFIPTNEQPTNLLTKPLGRTKFETARIQLNMVNIKDANNFI
jgi:hypothetical protein